MTQDPEALSDGTPSPPTCDPSGSATSSGNATDSGDVHLVEVGGRTLWLVGTAHVSQRSVDLVREVIERERPDAVCIELDAGRYEALSQAKRFEEQDLREVLRKKQLATLMLNLILASYQRRLGLKLGVAPGSELMEAARVAESLGIPTALCDRDVRITLRRAWQSISWWQRVKLVAELAASLFDSPEVSEEELARIRDQDVVTEVMNELGRMMPDLKRVLIDERDAYLAHEILETPGRRIVAVVGAGHIEGMKARLEREERTDLEAIKAIPPSSPVWKVVGWSIPLVIVGSIVAIAFTQGPEAAGENALLWFLANAIPSGIGALLALGTARLAGTPGLAGAPCACAALPPNASSAAAAPPARTRLPRARPHRLSFVRTISFMLSSCVDRRPARRGPTSDLRSPCCRAAPVASSRAPARAAARPRPRAWPSPPPGAKTPLAGWT